MSTPPPKPAWRSTKAASPKMKNQPCISSPTTGSNEHGDAVPFSEVSFFGAVSLGENVHLRSVASLAENDMVWVGNDRGVLTAHNNKSGRKVLTAELPPSCGPINCMVAVEGNVWAGCGSGELAVVDGASGTVLQRLSGGHKKSILSAVHDPSCAAVVTGGVDHSISIWSTKKMSLVTTIDSGKGAVTALTSFPAHAFPNVAFASGTDTHSITLWDNENSACGVLQAHDASVLCLQVVEQCESNARLWSGGADGSVVVWDVDSQSATKVLRGHEGGVTSLLLNDGEARVWSCGTDGLVIAWDIFTFEPLCTLSQHDAAVCAVPIARASVWRLWICGEDGTAQCYLSHASEDQHSSGSHWEGYAEECMEQIEQQHSEIKRLHELLRDEGNKVAHLKAAAAQQEQHRTPSQAHNTDDSRAQASLLSSIRTQFDLGFVELEETESRTRQLLTSSAPLAPSDLAAFAKECLVQLQTASFELDACSQERDHFQRLVVEHTSRTPSPAQDDSNRVQELEASLQVAERERTIAVRELHQCQSELLEQRHTSAETTKAQLEDFRRQNDSLRESARLDRHQFDAAQSEWMADKEALISQLTAAHTSISDGAESHNSQAQEIEKLKGALQLAQTAITTAKADVGRTTELERELEAQQNRGAQLHNALSSMELDAQEMRLTLEQQRASHEQQTQQLQSDLLSMRAPWETMKRALAESRAALESAKTQFVSDLTHLEQQSEAKDREIAVLKRSIAAGHGSLHTHSSQHMQPPAGTRNPQILDRLTQHVRRI